MESLKLIANKQYHNGKMRIHNLRIVKLGANFEFSNFLTLNFPTLNFPTLDFKLSNFKLIA